MTTSAFQKTIVFMIDGFDMAYYRQSPMPRLKKMAREGFFKAGSSIFPSLTNANNISIACGCWPEEHGVTTNCYYDREKKQSVFLEDSAFLEAPTIFERVARQDGGSALLTCKSKTTKIMGQEATLALAAEEPSYEFVQKFGPPPPMYSSEINYWLCDVALDLLRTRPELDLIYVHTTDYPMHMWPPQAKESQAHMQTLDDYLGRFAQTAPDHAIVLTADHGMNFKTRCWDLGRACRNRGLELAYAVSPVADRLLKHHGGFGGVSYVYLTEPGDREPALDIIMRLAGVEMVLDASEAARRFSLMPGRVGDLVVIPDRDTVFGDMPEEYKELPAEYRSHGSLYEMDIPLLLYNFQGPAPRYRQINYNLDLTRHLYVERS
jgi:phosphonoacetate hydrolase